MRPHPRRPPSPPHPCTPMREQSPAVTLTPSTAPADIDDEDVIELGELSNLGRVAPAVAARAAEEAAARVEGTDDAGTQGVPAAVSTEGMDDIDAALAEMI